MTKGGLVNNVEMSFAFDSTKNASTIKQLKKELEIIKDADDFERVESSLTIENYKVKFEKYKKAVSAAIRNAEKEVKKVHKFDIKKLQDYVEENIDEIEDRVEVKNKRYRFAKKTLNKISKTKYTNANSFLADYQEVIDSFNSSGLNRGKTIFSKKYKNIIKIIQLTQDIKSKEKEIEFRKAKDLLAKIPKMGINALTEILNVYYPKIFPVLNGRTIKVFENLGLRKYKDPNSFSTNEYFEYLDVMSEIKTQCKFTDFRATDLAISYYYRDEVKK